MRSLFQEHFDIITKKLKKEKKKRKQTGRKERALFSKVYNWQFPEKKSSKF